MELYTEEEAEILCLLAIIDTFKCCNAKFLGIDESKWKDFNQDTWFQENKDRLYE